MPDEVRVSPEQWQEMLSKQMEKQKMPTRATIPSTKPYKEKSFVSVHYTAMGEDGAGDSIYSNRNVQTYVVLHFYLRDNDTWQVLQRDARDYAQTFHHAKIICHDHAFTEPCSPAPKLRKCKEV